MTGRSTRRKMPGAGYHKQKRGPNGERLCRWCEKPVPPPKRTFCSDECIHEWRLRTDTSYLRAQVFKRDRGVCAICGLDTYALRRAVNKLKEEYGYLWWRYEDEILARLAEMGFRVPDLPHTRQTYWDADHIVPVVEGGGECGLDNLRTLCIWCHKRETAALARRRAGKPVQESLLAGGGNGD